MKRLFTVNGEHFDNKMRAKEARDAGPKGSKVMKGPDHIGNHGHSAMETRKRGPRDANGNRNTPPDMAKRAAKAAKAGR
jgi:hypothetical protein